MSGLRRARRPAVLVSLVAAILAVPAIAAAHAVVYPKASTPGAYEKYVLRVPNEKAVPTTRVELRFPSGLRVVSFGDVPGWRLETVTDSAQNIIAAIWTGALQPARFVELPFIAVNPQSAARLVWPAFQTYADGEKVEWTGPENGDRPASSTTIGPAAATPTAGATTNGDVARPSNPGVYLGAAALILALISLGLAMRPRTTAESA